MSTVAVRSSLLQSQSEPPARGKGLVHEGVEYRTVAKAGPSTSSQRSNSKKHKDAHKHDFARVQIDYKSVDFDVDEYKFEQ